MSAAIEILVEEIQPGDTLVADGFVPLTVTQLRLYPSHRLAVAHYDCTAGSGARTLCADSRVSVLRPEVEAL